MAGLLVPSVDFLAQESFVSGFELPFALKLLGSLFVGYIIGSERELRGKPAGISTHTYVIAGAMLFTLMSTGFGAGDPTRIAAQIVTGVGFLGAGVILKTDGGTVQNLTTAASIWFAAAIGMAIGFGWYLIAGIATLFAIIVPRMPRLSPKPSQDR
jgi:putative Mg2+ transporter-C (MgtC) family protein